MAHDPVCKLEINPLTAVASTKYKGHNYYFCSVRCMDYFKRNPGKYVKNVTEDKKGFIKRHFK